MQLPRHIKGAPRLFLAALFSLCLLASSVKAQPSSPTPGAQDDLTRGIELYERGDDKGAIETLRRVVKLRDGDIAAWHYLGLAYSRQTKLGDARKAHEKAARSAEKFLEQLYSGSDSPLITTKYEALLELAAKSATEFIRLSPNLSGGKLEEWNILADTLSDFARLADDGGSAVKIYTSREVDTKARILSRPPPIYPREARDYGVSGTVVLRAVFAFDGKVKSIEVVKGLPNGVTFRAVQAARKIKFIPATLNGNPVSTQVQIEYNFSLY